MTAQGAQPATRGIDQYSVEWALKWGRSRVRQNRLYSFHVQPLDVLAQGVQTLTLEIQCKDASPIRSKLGDMGRLSPRGRAHIEYGFTWLWVQQMRRKHRSGVLDVKMPILENFTLVGNCPLIQRNGLWNNRMPRRSVSSLGKRLKQFIGIGHQSVRTNRPRRSSVARPLQTTRSTTWT